jgi:hypothetical protein
MSIGNPRWPPPQGGHLGFLIGIKNRNLVKDIPMIILLQFGSVSSLVSEKKIFEISANQSGYGRT